jgi:P-type Mg2+ transporter
MNLLFIVAVTIITPFTPLAELFGFRAVSVLYLFVVAIIVSLYIVTAEIVKKIFYKTIKKCLFKNSLSLC